MLTQNFSFLPLVLSENKKILFICLHFLIVSMYTLRNPKNFYKYILNNHNKRPMANGAQNLLYKVIIFYAVTCGTCDILFFNMWCQSWSVAHSEHRMDRLTLGQNITLCWHTFDFFFIDNERVKQRKLKIENVLFSSSNTVYQNLSELR